MKLPTTLFIQLNQDMWLMLFTTNAIIMTYPQHGLTLGDYFSSIREYGSTLYVGMARKQNGHLYISIASDELKSLVIYTDKFYLIHI